MYKKLMVLTFFSLISLLFGKSYIISPILPPTQEVLKTDTSKCSKSCLMKLFLEGQVFSYISNYFQNDDELLKSNYQVAISNLDFAIVPPGFIPGKLKLALLIPQKSVGRYSITSSDTIISYLSTRDIDYEFRVFDSKDESVELLQKAYNDIVFERYDYIIALLTPNGLKQLAKFVSTSLPIYVPTVNKDQIDFPLSPNYILGGISYNDQVDLINKYAKLKKANMIIYNDSGYIGQMIGGIFNKNVNNIFAEEVVDSKIAANFSDYAKKIKHKAANSVIILNTSVIKSGLIIPQLSMQNIYPINYISTQINFNPSIFTLASQEFLDNLLIVNAIGRLNPVLITYAYLLNSNLKYDWVNYSTAIGVELFTLKNNPKIEKFFSEILQDNQVKYNNQFYGVRDLHFVLRN